MSKILSVVIPTHNRFRYAKYSILSILNLDLDIEIIVSDTSVENDLKSFVESLDVGLYPKSNLVYHYNKSAFDMAGNHNYALSLATGDYVCLIGDDDTISPFILDACSWMEKNNVEVLSQLTSVNYIWPDFETKIFGNAHAGRLYIDKNLYKLQEVESKTAFISSMKAAAQGTDGLPKLYHGIVKRTLLERIKTISGNYVHGASPDYSAAIALSSVCQSFYQTTFPLTVPGASGGSNTGRSALNKHKGSLASESQTKNNQASWETEIPSFFSVETVWADACFKSLTKLNVNYKNDFDYFGFYALLLLNHFDLRAETLKAFDNFIKSRNFGKFHSHSRLCLAFLVCLFKKLTRFILRLKNPSASGGKFFFADLNTVETVPVKVEEYFLKNKLRNIFL